jgi:hypothetical protein
MIAPIFVAVAFLCAQPPAAAEKAAAPAQKAVADKDLPWVSPKEVKKGATVRLQLGWTVEEVIDSRNMIVLCNKYTQPRVKNVDSETVWDSHDISPPMRIWVTGLPTDDIHEATWRWNVIKATVAAPKDAIGPKGLRSAIPHLDDCEQFIIPTKPEQKPPQVKRDGPNKAR